MEPEIDLKTDLEQAEKRAFDLEIREMEPGGELRIDGTAAVYNRWSEDLGGFREMIEPGFFENVLKNDVRALFNHNQDNVLGRTKAGTLSLEDTERGLDVHIDAPDTQLGRDVVTLIRRRDISQMSFAFMVKPDGEEWSREKDGSIRRVLKRGGAARLLDVSPVTYPAYPQTSVHVRSKIMEITGAEPAESKARKLTELKRQIQIAATRI